MQAEQEPAGPTAGELWRNRRRPEWTYRVERVDPEQVVLRSITTGRKPRVPLPELMQRFELVAQEAVA